MIRIFVRFLLIGLVATASLAADWRPPVPRGYVTDTVGALRSETVRWLAGNLRALERERGVQLAVLIVADLQGTTPMDFAQRTFDSWKIGNKSTRKGLLFLVATGDRKVRLHVGYGLEGDLPDGKVGALIDRLVTPLFKGGDLDGGVKAGVGGVMEALGSRAQAAGFAPEGGSRRRQGGSPGMPALLLVIGLGVLCMVSPFWRDLIFHMIVMSAFSSQPSGGSFSGGSGFGGFGGGSSGGGGSDRGW